MSRSMRYTNPIIKEHLASHYVLGLLSPLVRRRCESIMKSDPDFESAVYHWQANMNKLNASTPTIQPPSKVWKNIDTALSPVDPATNNIVSRVLDSLAFWKATAVGFACAAVLALVLPFGDVQPKVGANYVAMLNASQADAGVSSEAHLVISAYQGSEGSPSRLALQWNDRMPAVRFGSARIMAVSRVDGSVSHIGNIEDGVRSFALTKSSWLAVKESAELRIVVDDGSERVLFSGPCVQLKAWS